MQSVRRATPLITRALGSRTPATVSAYFHWYVEGLLRMYGLWCQFFGLLSLASMNPVISSSTDEVVCKHSNSSWWAFRRCSSKLSGDENTTISPGVYLVILHWAVLFTCYAPGHNEPRICERNRNAQQRNTWCCFSAGQNSCPLLISLNLCRCCANETCCCDKLLYTSEKPKWSLLYPSVVATYAILFLLWLVFRSPLWRMASESHLWRPTPPTPDWLYFLMLVAAMNPTIIWELHIFWEMLLSWWVGHCPSKALVKQEHTVVATLCPMMSPIPGKQDMFLKFFRIILWPGHNLCPLQMLHEWQNESTFAWSHKQCCRHNVSLFCQRLTVFNRTRKKEREKKEKPWTPFDYVSKPTDHWGPLSFPNRKRSWTAWEQPGVSCFGLSQSSRTCYYHVWKASCCDES